MPLRDHHTTHPQLKNHVTHDVETGHDKEAREDVLIVHHSADSHVAASRSVASQIQTIPLSYNQRTSNLPLKASCA